MSLRRHQEFFFCLTNKNDNLEEVRNPMIAHLSNSLIFQIIVSRLFDSSFASNANVNTSAIITMNLANENMLERVSATSSWSIRLEHSRLGAKTLSVQSMFRTKYNCSLLDFVILSLLDVSVLSIDRLRKSSVKLQRLIQLSNLIPSMNQRTLSCSVAVYSENDKCWAFSLLDPYPWISVAHNSIKKKNNDEMILVPQRINMIINVTHNLFRPFLRRYDDWSEYHSYN